MPKRSSFAKASLILALGWIGGLAISFAAEPNWPVLEFTQVQSGVGQTVDIQNAADGSGRLFLVRQSGQIQILKNGVLSPSPFLNVGSRIRNNGEQGLLGLAFPPNFAVAKCFYIYYCRSSDGATVLSRFRMGSSPNAALANSEEILLVTPKPQTNHNGGQLAFGPDGFLYLSIGDGGGAGDPQRNSQNLTNRLGKILRIDVENTSPGLPYAIPASNPFATSDINSREILCWGLRNPWRFSFDLLTGDLFIADVGEQRREEINFIAAASINSGTNFGWSVKEGTLDYVAQPDTTGPLQPPAFEYDRTLGSSVTGGYIYRGSNPRLHGFYLFGDYATGRIWAMESPAAGGRVALFKSSNHRISTFGKDEAGEIYFADYHGGGIHRIDALDVLPPPVISPPSGAYTTKVSFTMSTDVPGAVVRYTTDGSDPDANSPVFTPGASVEMGEPFSLRAVSYRPDLNSSAAAVATYQLRPAVAIGGGDGVLNNYETVPLSTTTPGAQIHYTLDGSTPTATSTLYTGQGEILVTQPLLLKAIAIKTGPGWLPGEVSGKYFSLRVATPALSQKVYDLHDVVHVTSATEDARLHYSLDGSPPTLSSPVWTGPLDLAPGTRITILAEKDQMTQSYATLDVFKISPQKTRFEQLGTHYMNSLTDVVHVNPTTLLAITPWEVYRHDGTSWSYIPQLSSGGGITSAALAANGDLTIANQGGLLSQYSMPSYAANGQLDCASAQIRDLLPLPTGGFLFTAYWDQRIRMVTDSSVITTFAGTATPGGTNGPAASASFDVPVGIARDPSGNTYVSEHAGKRIRKIDTDNMVTTLIGPGTLSVLDGSWATAGFAGPSAMCIDRIGNLYVVDKEIRSDYSDRIRKIRPDGTVTSLYGPIFEHGTFVTVAPASLGLRRYEGIDVDSNGVVYVTGKEHVVLKAVQEDWDNDGIPDTTEIALGAPFVVGIDDRLADADGDQFSNCAEWIAGTNALLSTSRPTGTTVTRHADGTVSLHFPCEPGRIHQLEYSDDLQNWKTMGVPWSALLRSFTTRLNATPTASQRYFRLRSTP